LSKDEKSDIGKLITNRAIFLESVKTPLGLLTLIVLVAEVALMVVGNVTDNKIILWAPFVVLILVVLCLLILALLKPEVLLKGTIGKKKYDMFLEDILKNLMVTFIDAITFPDVKQKFCAHFFMLEIDEKGKEFLTKKVSIVEDKSLPKETQLYKVPADDPVLIISKAFQKDDIIFESNLVEKYQFIPEDVRKNIDKEINWVIARTLKNASGKPFGVIDLYGKGECPFDDKKKLAQIETLLGEFCLLVKDLMIFSFGKIDIKSKAKKERKK